MRWLALCLLAVPAAAETPMDAEAFGAYVAGRTLSFSRPDGTPFGVEQYLPDRRAIWSPLDGTCLRGEWYEDAGRICFAYEGQSEPDCWFVYGEPGGLRVIDADSGTGLTLLESEVDLALVCGDLLS